MLKSATLGLQSSVRWKQEDTKFEVSQAKLGDIVSKAKYKQKGWRHRSSGKTLVWQCKGLGSIASTTKNIYNYIF
jgi:hypothetical protein